MKLASIKYYFLTLSLLGCSLLLSGQSSSNATVTIIGGDPVTESSATDPSVSPPPPENGGQLADPQNIEPTLENSFHIRYRIETPQKEAETQAVNEYASISTGTASAGSGGIKIKRKRVVTLEERRFNFKKKFKAWVPKRKKKYRPNVCGRF